MVFNTISSNGFMLPLHFLHSWILQRTRAKVLRPVLFCMGCPKHYFFCVTLGIFFSWPADCSDQYPCTRGVHTASWGCGIVLRVKATLILCDFSCASQIQVS